MDASHSHFRRQSEWLTFSGHDVAHGLHRDDQE
jgi:hypothetical protein